MADNDFKENLKYPTTYNTSEQQDMQEKLMHLIDEYQKNNSFENREFLCYLTSAIFLSYKKLFPQLNIYIPFRTKSDNSFIKNIQKEVAKYAKDTASDTFNIFPIENDISALRVVIDNINFTLPSTPESEALFNDSEIKELIGDNEDNKNEYSRRKNFDFINKVNDFINSPLQDGKQYLELKQELLNRIIKITPSEFTDERKPKPSFRELLEKMKEDYAFFLENDDFPTEISASEITELKTLLNDFRSRIDDKLQFAILEKTLPIVLEQPLVKNVLKTSSKFDKDSKKENGFHSIYYTISTPFGPVELQAQSNRAYYSATKGSAYHSGMDGKTVNVKDFFELVDPDDEHNLSYYLDTLDSISADKLISPYEIPEFKTEQEKKDFLKTPTGIAYLKSEKYREMMKHIRIKEKMKISPQSLPKEVYTPDTEIDTQKLQELIDSGKVLQMPTIVDANEYLFSTALSLSPYMNVCASGQTSFTNAGIHHKKVIGEFAEALRKRDSNTCLRDMLIRRLEDLIEEPEKFIKKPRALEHINDYLTTIVDRHDEMVINLPKDISQKNIIKYGEKLRNKMKPASDLDLVI